MQVQKNYRIKMAMYNLVTDSVTYILNLFFPSDLQTRKVQRTYGDLMPESDRFYQCNISRTGIILNVYA